MYISHNSDNYSNGAEGKENIHVVIFLSVLHSATSESDPLTPNINNWYNDFLLKNLCSYSKTV